MLALAPPTPTSCCRDRVRSCSSSKEACIENKTNARKTKTIIKKKTPHRHKCSSSYVVKDANFEVGRDKQGGGSSGDCVTKGALSKPLIPLNLTAIFFYIVLPSFQKSSCILAFLTHETHAATLRPHPPVAVVSAAHTTKNAQSFNRSKRGAWLHTVYPSPPPHTHRSPAGAHVDYLVRWSPTSCGERGEGGRRNKVYAT